jgi:hypothetical protein
MDFCFTRVYFKLYISQILKSMSYIEHNNVQYYLENEIEEYCLEEENNLNENEFDINMNENEFNNENNELKENNNIKSNSNNCLEINKTNFNNENKDILVKDNFSHSNILDKENKIKKKFEFISQTEENINKYKRMFIFKNNTFSKVEIQGLLVEKKTFQKEEEHKSRHVLRLDDSTGTIQLTSWRSKNENLYLKIRDFIVINIFQYNFI